MQLFPEFNQAMAAKHFDADAFTIMLNLGCANFCKYFGASNLVYRTGNAERPTWVRMNLQENEGGFNRLKIHYLEEECVRMEFYLVTPMPAGVKPLIGPVTTYEDVKLEYMGDTFQDATGQNMQGTPSESF